MAVSYNKLWKLLVDKKMSKADLRKASWHISKHYD
jgi:putative transcriptional regulator